MTAFRTPVTELLDRHGIDYRVLPHAEPVFTVEAAAQQRGVRPETMVKAILLRDMDRRFVLACLTGNARLDTRALRSQLPGEWKRLRFATADEIEEVTGFVQGAVSPLGLPDAVPVLFDQAVAQCEAVNISSGDPTAGLELAPADLIALSGGQLAQIAVST